MFTTINTDTTPMALGTYSATLYIKNSDTVAGVQEVPVKMHIVEPPPTYTLTVNAVGSGTVTPTVGTHVYTEGTVISVEAAPDAGWQFEGWTGDLTGASATESLTIDSDKAITATFAAITYTLTMSMAGNGVVTPTVGTHVYTVGTVISVEAAPDAGWQFKGWTGDLTGASATENLTIDSDKAIIATFGEIPIYGVNIEILTEAQTGDAGTTVTYTVRLTNTGNVADTFDIDAIGGINGWTTTPIVTLVGPLAPDMATNFQFSVLIPADAADGAIDTATVSATSQGDNTKSADVTIDTTANVAPAPDDNTYIYLPLVMK